MNIVKVKSMSATIVAAVLMGSLGFFVRGAGIDAAATAFFRFVVGFVLMSLVVLTPVLLKRRTLLFSPSSLFSGVAISLCILFYFLAIERTSIGLAAFTLYLGPVFAIIGEAIILRKFPATKQLIIIVIAFAGFFMISSIGADGSGVNSGLILALFSGILYGAYILINRVIPQAVTLSVRVFWQFLAAVITIGVALIFMDVSFDGLQTGWPYVLTIGVVQGFGVLLLTGYAIKNLTSIEFGTLSYIEPLVAVMLGYIIYSEALSMAQMAGIILIVIATALQCFAIKSK